MMAQRDGRERRKSPAGQELRRGRTSRGSQSAAARESLSDASASTRKSRARKQKAHKPGSSRTTNTADKQVQQKLTARRSKATLPPPQPAHRESHNQQVKSASVKSSAPAAKEPHITATHRTVEERSYLQRPAWMRAANSFFGARTRAHRTDRERDAREHRIHREHDDDENYETPVAAHRFSGKFLGILIMIAVLLLGTAYPLTNYVDQQREINTTRARIAELKQENVQLQAEKTWWQDDDYVRQQARSRLFYVAPGDTPYTVTGIDSDDGRADSTSASGKNAPEDSWTNKLWGSLNDGKAPSPKPADK